MTPLMFEHALIERAKADRRHIVLPEGNDDRILLAAEQLLRRGVVDLTVLGHRARHPGPRRRARADAAGGADRGPAHLAGPRGFRRGPTTSCASTRASRADMALDQMGDVSYFGTMMIHKGLADGMVSGAAHTTAHTIRPAFEFIRTAPGRKVVSSVFLMCLADRVLVYGDCAVVPEPGPRAARRHRRVGGRHRGDVRHRAAGGDAVVLDGGVGLGRGRRQGAPRRRRWPAQLRPDLLDRGPDPVRRGRRPGRRADQAAGQPGRRAGDGVRLPRPQHRQQHLQGGAALGGRGGDRAGAAGAEQAGQRPVARGAGARHRQHRGDHRDSGPEHGDQGS